MPPIHTTYMRYGIYLPCPSRATAIHSAHTASKHNFFLLHSEEQMVVVHYSLNKYHSVALLIYATSILAYRHVTICSET